MRCAFLAPRSGDKTLPPCTRSRAHRAVSTTMPHRNPGSGRPTCCALLCGSCWTGLRGPPYEMSLTPGGLAVRGGTAHLGLHSIAARLFTAELYRAWRATARCGPDQAATWISSIDAGDDGLAVLLPARPGITRAPTPQPSRLDRSIRFSHNPTRSPAAFLHAVHTPSSTSGRHTLRSTPGRIFGQEPA